MSEMKSNTGGNILGTQDVRKLLFKFAVPSVIAMLVGALYNIVDQIFIGQSVGMLGNAATNVAFPLVTIATALGLLFGVGGASNFNLYLGAGNRERAKKVVGNALFLLTASGLIMLVVIHMFLDELVTLFGATELVFPLALEYISITSYGILFLIFSTGASNMIRADGSPKYSMYCLLAGAVLNIILDAVFIFGLNMGIAGAAWATVISQVVSFLMAAVYFRKMKSVSIGKNDFLLKWGIVKPILYLGASSFLNQIAMMAVQIILNNTATYYGGLSVYGSEIPLAVAGVISKVSMIFISIIIGIAQGGQPIAGYNYGAKNYGRVKEVFKLVIGISLLISFVSFLCFQLFPLQIIKIFGDGSDLYFEFAVRFCRIFLMMMIVVGIQPASSILFTAIGKSHKGIFLAMIRQVILLIPLLLILPIYFGIDGILYAGPISDGIAAIIAFVFVYREMKELTRLENEENLKREKSAEAV
ncbi:Multidrug export protein MepA [Methanimicrococcus sp. At1]|uniref:Multidrug export protein MepA n=1 Tax=Methanimicrococcus hacksteinii TaxID=3028293 RepID=A0ABU3VPU7_9EURY|nr:MATE family efflux transporter [Methanimicrococcus sp. At1]MDV0445406.1 Multidrug export protein MepA [Methanimicrococcus sp. At1]